MGNYYPTAVRAQPLGPLATFKAPRTPATVHHLRVPANSNLPGLPAPARKIGGAYVFNPAQDFSPIGKRLKPLMKLGFLRALGWFGLGFEIGTILLKMQDSQTGAFTNDGSWYLDASCRAGGELIGNTGIYCGPLNYVGPDGVYYSDGYSGTYGPWRQWWFELYTDGWEWDTPAYPYRFHNRWTKRVFQNWYNGVNVPDPGYPYDAETIIEDVYQAPKAPIIIPAPTYFPKWLPSLVPGAVPVGSPMPEPAHVPYHLQPGKPQPIEIPQFNPWEWTPDAGAPDLVQDIPAAPPAGAPPGANPDPVPSPPPYARPATVALPGRPGRGVKERKVRVNGTWALLWNSFGDITESMDILKAAYDALPFWAQAKPTFKPKYGKGNEGPIANFASDGDAWHWVWVGADRYGERRSGWRRLYGHYEAPSAWERYQAIAGHLDELNVDRFLWNLAREAVADFAIGTIGQQVGKASRKQQRPIGFQAGLAF